MIAPEKHPALDSLCCASLAHSQGVKFVRMHQIKSFISKAIKVSAVLMSLLFCLLGYGYLSGSSSVVAIQDYINALEKYKTNNGAYPDVLGKLNVPASKRVLGVFPSSEITYKITGSEFIIYYIQFPFGPGHVYSSENKEWYFDEI